MKASLLFKDGWTVSFDKLTKLEAEVLKKLYDGGNITLTENIDQQKNNRYTFSKFEEV